MNATWGRFVTSTRGVHRGRGGGNIGGDPHPRKPCTFQRTVTRCGMDIAPCPFFQSGSSPWVDCDTGLNYQVVCPECGARGPLRASRTTAIETWNAAARRASTELGRPMVGPAESPPAIAETLIDDGIWCLLGSDQKLALVGAIAKAIEAERERYEQVVRRAVGGNAAMRPESEVAP